MVCPGPVDTGLLDATGPGANGTTVNARRYPTNAAGPAFAARCSPGVTERALTHFMRRELAAG